MMKNNLDSLYWNLRYKTNDAPWSLGEPSPPLKTYIDQIEDKKLKILIPGAGMSFEASYLYEKGFKDVFVNDISENALNEFIQRNPNFPESRILYSDFFDLNRQFDLILEQTFFCALHPTLRIQYITKMHELLSKKGNLVGLLFQFKLTDSGPPYGGSREEYIELFDKKFRIKTLDTAYNSVENRENKELFFIFEKRQTPS